MKILLCSIVVHLMINSVVIRAQDVGIGITTPRSNLHVFGGASGNLNPFRPLVVENINASYINLLTLSTQESGVLFGNPSSAAAGGMVYSSPAALINGIQFRYGGNITGMNLNNLGSLGIGNVDPSYSLDISGRMRLRSGGNFGISAGTWLNNNDNSALQSFIGVENDSYVGIFNFVNGFSFGVNSTTGDVKMMAKLGIGTTTPNAPLSFQNVLGKKLGLYPGASGEFGFASRPAGLQIYGDNPNADIAFGYDQGGTMTEKFRFKGNGVLMLAGNAGTQNQVLTSGGSGAVQFQSLGTLYKSAGVVAGLGVNHWSVGATSDAEVEVPALSTTITILQTSRLVISASAHFLNVCSGFDCVGSVWFYFKVDGVAGKKMQLITTTEMRTITIPAYFYDAGAGTHTISFWFIKGTPGDNNLIGNGIMSSVLAIPL